MKAATAPRAAPGEARLLHVDPHGNGIFHRRARELPEQLDAGDLVVVNDAATLPASLRVPALDAELRLIARGPTPDEFTAVLFGAGDHRTPTEHRPEPPRVHTGQRLELGSDLELVITGVDETSPRLLRVRFSTSGARLLAALYRLGRPIQYAHVPAPLELWDVQNRYASRPWAFELPSAGLVIDGELLLALRRRRVGLVTVTHAAGISSTGSDALDRRFPLAERFEIPESTARALVRTRRLGGRVLAVGTTVVRALEASALEHGAPRAGSGEAHLVLGPGFVPRVVDGVLSGMHEQGTSHFALLSCFAPRELLDAALHSAEAAGYLQHEFGDACLLWPGRHEPTRHAHD